MHQGDIQPQRGQVATDLVVQLFRQFLAHLLFQLKQAMRVLPHGFLDLLSLGDVQDRPAADHVAPFFVLYIGRVQKHSDARTILADHHVFEPLNAAALLESGEIGPEDRPALLRDQIREGLPAHDLVAFVSEPFQLGVVDTHIEAVLVQGVVAAGGVVV